MKNEERNTAGQINLRNAVIDFECQINILNILNVGILHYPVKFQLLT